MGVGIRNRLVHRLVYEVFRDGKEIQGRQIHHICGNQWCVNPWHMEAVTQSEHTKAHRIIRGVEVKLRFRLGVKVKLNLRPPKLAPEVLRARKREYRKTYRTLYPDKWRLLKRAQRARYRARLKEKRLH